MKIQNIFYTQKVLIPRTNINNQSQALDNHTKKKKESTLLQYYPNYAIPFSARLFRTPENFYAQPFNKIGMPITMKSYLDDDFEDRQKMPPAQMLKLVFDDINETKNLEQVKKIYPDEPLFDNLTDKPTRNARTGILADIEIMKDEDIPLFKNGENNLGLYILKKIYTEAKTLKEINSDFQNDITNEYKGISPIDYETLKAFGIKFPNNSFWKSLTATREEFPYEYKPRKSSVARKSRLIQTNSKKIETNNNNKIQEKPKKFGKVKDWEIDKITDAIIKGNGSKAETEKLIKKKNIQDKDTQTFVNKYLGEINTIVLEKLHISEDMKDYFENYEDLTKTQREKFESYMKNPFINEQRSKVMSATIKLFFDLYGADGNNEDFQELLDYAHSIKPARIARQKEHDRIQAEYEKELGIFETPQEIQEEQLQPIENKSINDEKVIDTIDNIIKDLDKEKFVKIYEFSSDEGPVKIVADLKEAFGEYLDEITKIMPDTFASKFKNYALNNSLTTEPYILSILLKNKGIQVHPDNRILSDEDTVNSTLEIYQNYTDTYQVESRAAQQAVTDAYIEFTKELITPSLFRLGIFEFIEIYKDLNPEEQKFIDNQKKMINEKYNIYKKPLTDSETNKITITIMDLLRKYNPDKSIIKKPSSFVGFDSVFYSLRLLAANKNNKDRDNFKSDIYKYVKEYGGSARFLIDKDMPEALKMAKLEQFLCCFTYDKPGVLLTYSALNRESMEYLKKHNPKIYQFLKTEVLYKLPELTTDSQQI